MTIANTYIIVTRRHIWGLAASEVIPSMESVVDSIIKKKCPKLTVNVLSEIDDNCEFYQPMSARQHTDSFYNDYYLYDKLEVKCKYSVLLEWIQILTYCGISVIRKLSHELVNGVIKTIPLFLSKEYSLGTFNFPNTCDILYIDNAPANKSHGLKPKQICRLKADTIRRTYKIYEVHGDYIYIKPLNSTDVMLADHLRKHHYTEFTYWTHPDNVGVACLPAHMMTDGHYM